MSNRVNNRVNNMQRNATKSTMNYDNRFEVTRAHRKGALVAPNAQLSQFTNDFPMGVANTAILTRPVI